MCKKRKKLILGISVSNERLENNKNNFSRYEKEIEELKKRIGELEGEKGQKQEKKSRLFANKEKFENELKEKEAELADLMSKLTEKEKAIEEKKAKTEQFTDEKYEKLNEISILDTTNENIDKRLKTLKYDMQFAISELDSTNMTRQDLSNVFSEIEEKRNKVASQIEETNRKREEEERSLKEYDTNINSLQSEYRIKESRLKFLIETEKEKEGYSKTVKSLLIACDREPMLKKCSEGVLSELISVDNKYQIAIEMALGATLQNIITNNEQDAKKLVEYLRENKLGRASFLPISSVKGKRLEKFQRGSVSSDVVIASDIVKSDKKYEQIILNLLGRTVIVEDMQDAIDIAKQNRIFV